jgi:type 1 fimbria pilin
MKRLIALLTVLGALSVWSHAADMPMPGDKMASPKSGSDITVTGEVLDMACYLDHGAQGEKHADCAKIYLLIGQHKPANDQLAEYAAKTVTVKGKFVARDGVNLLENIEIVK